uniref:SJCHGC05966 protein n=1 Tax=Schistosoma japonicum TaxID=6182 RepID=Q5DBL3_SCHJA|nr:SJCHGC05966 protein [Schistosoma japonicum]
MTGQRRSTKRTSDKKADLVPEERTFVNPSALSPHLFCPICQEAFCDPQRAPCGHSFCKNCIELWIRNTPNCPVDRKPIPKGSMHHDFIVENIIGDYMVACPWRALGCDFIGQLCLLPGHKKICVMNPSTMPPALRAHTTACLNKVNSNQSVEFKPFQNNQQSSVKVSFVFQSQLPSNTVTTTERIIDGNEGSNNQSNSTQSRNGSSSYDGANEESVIFVSDDEADLPPAPPPSLLFRLYHSSDANSRDLLCDLYRIVRILKLNPLVIIINDDVENKFVSTLSRLHS